MNCEHAGHTFNQLNSKEKMVKGVEKLALNYSTYFCNATSCIAQH